METLAKFFDFYVKITADTGRKYKLDILESIKDDEDIKRYLHFLLNTYITTGLSAKKYNKLEKMTVDHDIVTPTATVLDMMDYIKMYNTGADNYMMTIKDFIDKFVGEQYRALFRGIMTKNLPLGVDAKTVNKVMPGLIPTFDVMLANKYFDNPKVVEGKEFALTTKIDGCRIIAIKDHNKVTFWTRQGQPYEGLVDLEDEMLKYIPDGLALDGELTLLDKGDLDSGEQYKATTKLCRTKDTEKHGLKMLVFDCILAEDFKEQKSEWTYDTRRNYLESIMRDFYDTDGNLIHSFKYFELLPILYRGSDTSKITEILDEQVDKGEEGIMINIVDACYDFRRTNALLKCKKFQDTEVKVIGFEEGTNKLFGTLGALICEYKGSVVKVGSGFTDDDRDYIWWHKYEYENKYITVKYFEESYDSKTGLPSLRFPIFKGLRVDK